MVFLEPPKDFSSSMYVVAGLLQDHDRLLFVWRHPQKNEGNKWGIPAGKRKEGETPEAAVIREVQEETGIILTVADLIKPLILYLRYPEMDYIFHLFSASFPPKSEIRLDPRELQRFCWMTVVEALRQPLVLGTDRCLELFYGTASGVDAHVAGKTP